MLSKHILTGKISILRFLKIHTYNIYKYCNNDTKYHSPQVFSVQSRMPIYSNGICCDFPDFPQQQDFMANRSRNLASMQFLLQQYSTAKIYMETEWKKKSYLFFFLADPQRDFCLQIELLQSFFWFAKLKVGPYSLRYLDEVSRSCT